MTAHPGNLANREPLGQKQPKPKNGTKAGWRHMNRVKQLPCVICGAHPPSEAHHCRSDGMARDDFKTISLCKPCHTGPNGFHTRKATWEATNGKDFEFLAVVADMLAGELTPFSRALTHQAELIAQRRVK